MPKEPIFLSASIPDRDPYVRDADPIAIREAVLALVAVTVRERHLVFGGHPAISPLVEHAASSLNAVDNVDIFQSEWFRAVIPPEARAFQNLKGIGKSNGLFHRPLLPPSATRPHRRTQAGRGGGRAPAPGGAGLRLPGGG
jgi:hypothetical protein